MTGKSLFPAGKWTKGTANPSVCSDASQVLIRSWFTLVFQRVWVAFFSFEARGLLPADRCGSARPPSGGFETRQP